jgi:diaminopimelate epimerase
MQIPFFKYQATGNDFVMIDNRECKYNLSKKQVAFVCNRHLGVGSDGLILLESIASNAGSTPVAFRMCFYNPDGTSGMMCGNGGRAVVAFAYKCGIKPIGNTYTFMAPDAQHKAWIEEENENIFNIKLSMGNVSGSTIKEYDEGVFLNTGTNHFVCFVSDTETIDIRTQGAKIRYDKRFQTIGGTNCNFVQQIDKYTIKIRTYERGVENETLSCGTGITASAIAYAHKNNLAIDNVAINAKGGNLKVFFNKDSQGNYNNVFLQGKAQEVFAGSIELFLE